jgi:aminoglycoside phosphotransferase family enzyme
LDDPLYRDQHAQLADWFAQRIEEGRIRDCHGDLRAEHVYAEPGQFQIIDCIEFNQRFRYIDVASEVAFLAMDLERLGAPDAVRQFVQAYVRASRDVDLYRLLDFYCGYRQNFSVQLNQRLNSQNKKMINCRSGTHWNF